jgi:hypothetical protein
MIKTSQRSEWYRYLPTLRNSHITTQIGDYMTNDRKFNICVSVNIETLQRLEQLSKDGCRSATIRDAVELLSSSRKGVEA